MTSKLIRISKSEKKTQKIARDLAVKIIRDPASLPTPRAVVKAFGDVRPKHRLRRSGKLRRTSIIALEGELGAGKTTFVKGFAKALGISAKVKSPTFTLMKKYEIFSLGKTQNTKTKSQIKSKIQDTRYKFMIHLDCYRVKDHRDLATLDLKSLFKSPDNIVLIEWSERVSKILPKKLIRVHIDHIDKNKRKITVK